MISKRMVKWKGGEWAPCAMIRKRKKKQNENKKKKKKKKTKKKDKETKDRAPEFGSAKGQEYPESEKLRYAVEESGLTLLKKML